MATGYKTQLTRQIGEHTVVAELGRREIIATPFAGNVPDYDIVAADLYGNSMMIQVKAINGPSWQFNITSFLDIEMDGKCQVVKGKKKLNNPDLICVFVLIKEKKENEFYIFKMKDLQNHFYKNYKGGVRPKNPESMHCAIFPKDIIKYKDKWNLIAEKFQTKL